MKAWLVTLSVAISLVDLSFSHAGNLLGQLPTTLVPPDTSDNYLIDYTLGGPYIFTGIVGLDGQGNKAFDYQYDEPDFCGTVWNAAIIHWDNLQLK